MSVTSLLVANPQSSAIFAAFTLNLVPRSSYLAAVKTAVAPRRRSSYSMSVRAVDKVRADRTRST